MSDDYYTHLLGAKKAVYEYCNERSGEVCTINRYICRRCRLDLHDLDQEPMERNDCKNLFFVFVKLNGEPIDDAYQKELFDLYRIYGANYVAIEHKVKFQTAGQCCCCHKDHGAKK